MARLKIVTQRIVRRGRSLFEDGFAHMRIIHSACRLRWDGGRERWMGWQPHRSYGSAEGYGRGYIEEEDKDAAGLTDNWVEFEVTDAGLSNAERMVVREYVVEHDDYIIGALDCVTFARDVAKWSGLRVSGFSFHWADPGITFERFDFFPYELLMKLYKLNEQKVIDSNVNPFD